MKLITELVRSLPEINTNIRFRFFNGHSCTASEIIAHYIALAKQCLDVTAIEGTQRQKLVSGADAV